MYRAYSVYPAYTEYRLAQLGQMGESVVPYKPGCVYGLSTNIHYVYVLKSAQHAPFKHASSGEERALSHFCWVCSGGQLWERPNEG